MDQILQAISQFLQDHEIEARYHYGNTVISVNLKTKPIIFIHSTRSTKIKIEGPTYITTIDMQEPNSFQTLLNTLKH